MILVLWLIALSVASANYVDEARAIIAWLDAPFNSTILEAERDAQLQALQNPKKGEFETTAMFEQRQKDAQSHISALNREYNQKIADARAAYQAQQSKLRQRLSQLLNQSRETISMGGSIGTYDADKQTFPIVTEVKTFQVMVPLNKAAEVKKNSKSYGLKLIRQLDENLEWEYLQATLSGPEGTFSSTDKAPALQSSSSPIALIPPDLKATVTFTEPSGNNILDSEETATVQIKIQNSGKGAANMVEADFELINSPGVSFARSIYFGEIKAGESLQKSLQLVAGMDTKDGRAELRIKFKEQNGFPANDVNLAFDTRALQAPDLYIADIGIEDFNKNNKIEPGEPVSVTVRVHNKGVGLAKNVTAEVLLGESVYFGGEASSNFNLGNMNPGDYKDIEFDIITAKTAKNLEIKLNLKESRNQFSKLNQALELAFNKVERTADQMLITGIQSSGQIAAAPSLSIDVEQDIPVRGKSDKKKWGVIFGIESYRKVGSVRFARRDASSMRDYFEKVLGIPAANLYIKMDDEASLSELKLVFDEGGWLSKNASGKDNEIYIYFSGHGAPSQDGKSAWLLPHDGDPNYTQSSAYSMDVLMGNLKKIQAKQINVFLDSCFSGANRDNEIILADARPVFISTPLPTVASNMAVFTASSGSQISSAYSDMQHGLFSYFLMKGLKGEADANKDKKITQQELYDYVNQEVSSMARRLGREQEPQLQSIEPNKVMVKW